MSGVTNMYATCTVEELSGLSREEQMEIREHYAELKEKYMECA